MKLFHLGNELYCVQSGAIVQDKLSVPGRLDNSWAVVYLHKIGFKDPEDVVSQNRLSLYTGGHISWFTKSETYV